MRDIHAQQTMAMLPKYERKQHGNLNDLLRHRADEIAIGDEGDDFHGTTKQTRTRLCSSRRVATAGTTTKFLALDKCLGVPRRQFLEAQVFSLLCQ